MSDRISQLSAHLNYPKGLLAGQVAIITGSGQGIGAEAARLFAKEGAKVVIADIDASSSGPNLTYTHHQLTPFQRRARMSSIASPPPAARPSPCRATS